MLFSDVYRVVWRHRLLVVCGTLACVALAVALTASRQKLYEASAVVRLEPAGDSSANDRFEASQRLSRSYAEIYQRGAVNRQIDTLLGSEPPVREKELAAGQVKDLDLLAVSGISDDPQRAARIANAGWRALEQFSQTERLILITAAQVPDSPASPNLKLNLALALVCGFILSVGLALVRNAVVQPLSDPERIEEQLGIPVIAELPSVRFGRGAAPVRGSPLRSSPRLFAAGEPDEQPDDEPQKPAVVQARPSTRSRTGRSR